MPQPAIVDQFRFYIQQAFSHYDPHRTLPAIDVELYPYTGINHTIRIREGRIFVRIADICHDMPAEAQRGLAYVLVSKLYRRRVPKWARETYSAYIRSEHLRERSTSSKKTRGRKVVSGTQGEIYDLNELFDDLNTKYFNGALPKPVLTWSARKTYRILGHHDSTHDTVVISRSLDTADTPRYVVEFVLFHEMLHIHHPTVHHNGRRYNHTPEFKRDERKFVHFNAAESWIESNVRRMKRAVKREKRR